ncbi:MAG: M15 family metallopeptidase [Christensenellales bacterium]|jgi:D-alanyl-D-alanine carboxypeptidase
MTKLFCAVCAICLALQLPLPLYAAEQPPWTFPVRADILENRSRLLDIASRDNPLDADYVPHNLVPLKLRSVVSGPELRREAADALTRMFEAADQAGYTLYVKSAYRSYQTQSTMYANRLDKYNKDDGVVAYPGTSDHQTGLGVDILNLAWTKQDGMRPEFGQTAEAQWMASVCHEYGFILRYMDGKQDITGIIYEPWHFRYVGEEVAQYIMENNLTLEEFVEQARQAIVHYEQQGGDFYALCRELTRLPDVVELTETDSEGDSELSFYKTNES